MSSKRPVGQLVKLRGGCSPPRGRLTTCLQVGNLPHKSTNRHSSPKRLSTPVCIFSVLHWSILKQFSRGIVNHVKQAGQMRSQGPREPASGGPGPPIGAAESREPDNSCVGRERAGLIVLRQRVRLVPPQPEILRIAHRFRSIQPRHARIPSVERLALRPPAVTPELAAGSLWA
jgi:hypothetical protein